MAQQGYLIAIAAYVLMACSQLVDKAFLSRVLKNSRAYVGLVGLLNGLVLFFPLGASSRLHLAGNGFLIVLSLLFGACFILALLPFLSALQGEDASRVIPIVGSLLPIFLLIGERVLYGTVLPTKSLLAFCLLVIGALIMTISHEASQRLSISSAAKAMFAALLFAISFAGSKYVYSQLSFAEGFFWLRIGGFAVGLGLLLLSDVRESLRQFFRQRPAVISGYLGNQLLSGVGFVLQNYAIVMTSVSLVSALQGVQYAFLVFFAALATLLYPSFIKEPITVSLLTEKIVAVLFIGAGLALLFL